MRIRSINDVITNSSDETFIIRTKLSPDEVQAKFEAYMEKFHPYEWNDEWKEYGFRNRDTYAPDSYTETDDGNVMISWDVMCNLDSPQKYLEECFGDENVEDIGWR